MLSDWKLLLSTSATLLRGTMVTLQLKPKHIEAVQAVNDPTVDTLVLLGVVGSGKTDVAAHIDLCIAVRMF